MRKRVGSNIISVIEAAREVIDEETPKIGDDVKVSYLFDDSKDVRSLLSDLGNNVGAAVIIVMVVVLAVLGTGNPRLFLHGHHRVEFDWRNHEHHRSVLAYSGCRHAG